MLMYTFVTLFDFEAHRAALIQNIIIISFKDFNMRTCINPM